MWVGEVRLRVGVDAGSVGLGVFGRQKMRLLVRLEGWKCLFWVCLGGKCDCGCILRDGKCACVFVGGSECVRECVGTKCFLSVDRIEKRVSKCVCRPGDAFVSVSVGEEVCLQVCVLGGKCLRV